MNQMFGGDWTEKKLSRLKKYLVAYTTIFHSNPAASHFTITYLDAFAGTGFRKSRGSKPLPKWTLFGITSPEVETLRKGSASIALETEPAFHKYIFIDSKLGNVDALHKLRALHKKKSIDIERADANVYIQNWCAATNWRKNRAVVFIDPFGMQVEWKTLAALGKTQAIDLWLLFPLGQGVNRLLTRSKPPKGLWADRLTIMFGNDEWKTKFYESFERQDLFGDSHIVEQKTANWGSIEKYFVDRLGTVFHGVSQKPLALRNSRNVPIFLLCFAAGNPRGSKPALRIADYLLKN